MATLDRSRPFGQVFGSAGYSFEQDGRLFDHRGDEWFDPNAAPPNTVAKPRSKPGPKPKQMAVDPVDAELDAQMKA